MSNRKRPPTEAESTEARTLTLTLRARMAAPGAARVDLDGVARAPQRVVAEAAGVREADLSAVIHGRKPSGRAVGAILERLRQLEQTFNVEKP